MLKLFNLFVVSFVLPALLAGQPEQIHEEHSIAFLHVTLVDVASGKAQPDMTVVIAGGHITQTAKSGTANVPVDARQVDASSKFLIPGLWDMHIHTFSYENGRQFYPLLIANGITGTRDMGTPLNDILKVRREVEAGQLLGPHIVAAGPILTSVMPAGMENNPLLASAATNAIARATIDSLVRAGVDFIKINYVDKEILIVISDECRKRNISFVGHLPFSISAQEASIAGMKSIEHLGGSGAHGVLRSCSDKQDILQDSVRRWTTDLSQFDGVIFYKSTFTKLVLDSYDTVKAKRLCALFVKNKTWQTPTLAVLDSTWQWNSGRLDDDDKLYGMKIRQKQFELVHMMERQGVGLLAGTDLPISKPALHDELETLVHAGLTPYQALQTATINPAKFLGLLGSLGTIEKGKIADLVLLDANPLEDIRNTRRISAVVVRGKYFDRSGLDTLVAKASKTSDR